MKTLLTTLFLAIMAIAAQDNTGTTSAILEERDWKMTELEGQPLPEGLKRIPQLRFSKGKVSGNSGCNQIFGGYQAQDGRLKFGMLGGTLMACAPPDVEASTKKALGKVARYNLVKGQLSLLDAQGKVLARFVAL